MTLGVTPREFLEGVLAEILVGPVVDIVCAGTQPCREQGAQYLPPRLMGRGCW